jgi:peptidoglycan lytic transglycosylase
MYLRYGLAAVVLCAPLAAGAETMVASYYAAPAPHIAAHRSLPFGTRVILTNPRNGRTAHVVIRDRGPFVAGRALDISTARARQLGLMRSGVARLTARVLRR